MCLTASAHSWTSQSPPLPRKGQEDSEARSQRAHAQDVAPYARLTLTILSTAEKGHARRQSRTMRFHETRHTTSHALPMKTRAIFPQCKRTTGCQPACCPFAILARCRGVSPFPPALRMPNSDRSGAWSGWPATWRRSILPDSLPDRRPQHQSAGGRQRPDQWSLSCQGWYPW